MKGEKSTGDPVNFSMGLLAVLAGAGGSGTIYGRLSPYIQEGDVSRL